jgi:hypothetical protein
MHKDAQSGPGQPALASEADVDGPVRLAASNFMHNSVTRANPIRLSRTKPLLAPSARREMASPGASEPRALFIAMPFADPAQFPIRCTKMHSPKNGGY